MIQGKTLRHTFSILPTVNSPVLIGFDLWSRLDDITTTAQAHDSTKTHYCRHDAARSQRRRPLSRIPAHKTSCLRTDKGPTDKIEHVIRIKTDVPMKQSYRAQNPALQKIIDNESQEMLQNGIIKPSASGASRSGKRTDGLVFASTSGK